jgi:hypothetical protein
MKNKVYTLLFPILFLLAVVFISGCQIHEGKAAEEIFDKYEGQEGVYTFRIPPGLIGIFLDEEENRELKETLREMDFIKVMILDEKKAKSKDKVRILQEFDQKLKENDFEDLLLFNEGTQMIKIKIREQEDFIHEMMILITEEDSFLGLSLVGKISLDRLSSIAKSIDIGDFMEMSN